MTPSGRARLWGSALAALALTLWLAGPRAWRVVAQRIEAGAASGNGPVIDLDRVGVRSQPDWLGRAALAAVLRDLAPALRGDLELLDDDGGRRLEQKLLASPWVSAVALRREFPDRFVAELRIRRPVLAVWVGGDPVPQVAVDAAGVCLPFTPGLDLPRTTLRDGARIPPEQILGRRHFDPRVLAAAAVAVEWRDELAPRVPGAPPLCVVDAANLGYRYLADGRYSEVLVGLARGGGGIAWLDYGHPPGSRWPRVPLEVKVEVLGKLLAVAPDLAHIDRGDLRFANRWRDWVRPRLAGAERR